MDGYQRTSITGGQPTSLASLKTLQQKLWAHLPVAQWSVLAPFRDKSARRCRNWETLPCPTAKSGLFKGMWAVSQVIMNLAGKNSLIPKYPKTGDWSIMIHFETCCVMVEADTSCSLWIYKCKHWTNLTSLFSQMERIIIINHYHKHNLKK